MLAMGRKPGALFARIESCLFVRTMYQDLQGWSREKIGKNLAEKELHASPEVPPN
jgi:hypothetical protein